MTSLRRLYVIQAILVELPTRRPCEHRCEKATRAVVLSEAQIAAEISIARNTRQHGQPRQIFKAIQRSGLGEC